MPRLTETDIQAVVRAEIDNATLNSGRLTHQRQEANKYYLAEPFGDERDGRSKVVLSDVADTIEWILPSLLRIFNVNNPVEFTPVGIEDEPKAEQETDYASWVFLKDNPGFMILYTWFKDALLQKNGIVKHWWEESERVEKETYENLLDEQLAEVVFPDDVEVLEHTPRLDGSHDVKISRKTKDGRVAIANVPPEEFLISRNAKTIEDTSFCCHKSRKTRSELIEQGFDRKKIMDAAQAGRVSDDEGEKDARHQNDDTQIEDFRSDRAMQEVEFFECYVRIDRDGDNIAELLKVDMVGNTVLEIEEADFIPFSSITPIPMPHKFHGLSIADLVMDIQRIRSTIVRQGLDNMYRANDPGMEIPEAAIGEHTMEDAQSDKPTKFVRTAQGGLLQPFKVDPTWPQIIPMLESFDRMKQERTGVTRFAQGLDPETLSNQKTELEVNTLNQGSQQRVEMIARIFAETGVRDLFLAIHQLVRKYQDVERIVKLRGDYVPVDPSGWRERTDVTVNVGLGMGTKEQQAGILASVVNQQLAFRQIPGLEALAPVASIREAFSRFVEAAGIKAVDLIVPEIQSVPMSQEELQAVVQQAKQEGALEAQQQAQAQAEQLAQAQSAIDTNKEQVRLIADLERQQAKHEDEVELTELEQEHELEKIGAKETLSASLRTNGARPRP